jgi:hypothetical protein
MAESPKIPWPRILAEGLAIVVSILFAFGIDAWWTARQLHLDEQDILRQLDAEFQTNAALLAERRLNHEEILAAIKLVLSVTGPESDQTVAESPELRLAIDRITRWWTYDPQMGVLSGLTQSGRLSIISSDPLRNALASWPSRVRDLVEDEIFAREITANQLDPYLNRKVSRRKVVVYQESVGVGRFPSELAGILADQEFENIVHLKLGLTLGVLEEYDGLESEISEVRTLIVQASEAG